MNLQTLNPYVYCLNNPMKYIDPDGESPWDHKWLPDGDVEVDPATWDTFYDPELRQKYYDEWAQKSSSSSGRKHKSKRSWQDKIKDSFYFTGDYEVSEIQFGFGGFLSFISLTNMKTGETRYYVSGGFGLYAGGQALGGRANIESFEGPFTQMSSAFFYGGEATFTGDEQGNSKMLDLKFGPGFAAGGGGNAGLLWGYTLPIEKVVSWILNIFKNG